MTARLGSSEERPGWLLLRGRVDRVSQDDVSSFSLLDRRVAEFCARVLAQGMEFLVAEQRRLRWIDRTAHELTSPAAAIRSAADLLERRGSELSDAQSHRMLSLIDRACLQLVEKVDGLRRVRRLGKPREPVRPKLSRIELREDVLIPVVDEHYGYAKDNGVHLEARWTNAGVSPQLWVDREGMEVLFGNLVQNAVKYRNPQTQQCRIDITLCEEAGTWLVELADWGIGVAPELKDRIFEGGFRAPNAQQVAVTGSGHGLPIAREIAKAHLGDIRCRRTSRPTVFQVVLPRALESPDWWDNRTR